MPKDNINSLNSDELIGYNELLVAIENIPPYFSETKRNIINKLNKYIQIQKGQVSPMSKLYDKYIELKSNPDNKKNTLYLFKSGLFFIFIDNDAQIVSNFLNLKLSHLNENIVKCGFPVQSLEKYLGLLKNMPYHIEIVSFENEKTLPCNNYLYEENVKKVVDEILKTNIDSLSISEAYDFLHNIQNTLKLNT